MEKVYKTMKSTGAGSLAAGIIILVAGLSVGIYMIVNAGRLLRRKEDLLF